MRGQAVGTPRGLHTSLAVPGFCQGTKGDSVSFCLKRQMSHKAGFIPSWFYKTLTANTWKTQCFATCVVIWASSRGCPYLWLFSSHASIFQNLAVNEIIHKISFF